MMDAHVDEAAAWIRSALDRFEVPLLSYATRLTQDLHAARDVVQDVFLRLCEQDRARVEARLAPWLFSVCRNRALDERRKRKPRPMETLRERDDGPAGSSEVDDRDDEATALRAIENLPAALQEVVLLKFRYGLGYRAIAEVTGLSISHVGVRIHEGMKRLRDRFRERPAARVMEGGAR